MPYQGASGLNLMGSAGRAFLFPPSIRSIQVPVLARAIDADPLFRFERAVTRTVPAEKFCKIGMPKWEAGWEGCVELAERDPGSPHDLIRIGITMTALAVAIAALRTDQPDVYFFLVIGLVAAWGTGYAMFALWQAAGLGVNHLVTGVLPAELDSRYSALVVLTWAMIAILGTLVYLIARQIYF